MSNELYGYLVEFNSVDALIAASEKVRDKGFTRWDAHTPFVVHGLDGAMGIKQTILPWLVLGGGAAGCLGGILLQWWTNAVNYPFMISGKPLFSLPANIPVAFETTILLAAITALVSMLALNGLPQLFHPLHRSARFKRATNDRFFISLEATDPMFDPEHTLAFAQTLGGVSIQTVEA